MNAPSHFSAFFRNGQGHDGYGSYGMNVGIGNIDEDSKLEIIVTYDNHAIQAFKYDGRDSSLPSSPLSSFSSSHHHHPSSAPSPSTGVAIDLAPFFTNRANSYLNKPLTWGQVIRWTGPLSFLFFYFPHCLLQHSRLRCHLPLHSSPGSFSSLDPWVDEDHFHRHTGTWPHPSWTEWNQLTESPPNIVDLDLDGKFEVLVAPNIEKFEPYVTQAYGLFAIEGSYNNGSRSGMRFKGFERMPRGEYPKPGGGIPGIASVDILGMMFLP